MEEIKRLPLGVNRFTDLVDRNMYYVDKTMFLPTLEFASDFIFFIRPRRFGKSLLISMMSCYYDCLQQDKFEHYFGNLWVGSHQTKEKGQYQILYFDFSQVSYSGNNTSLEENFNNYCKGIMDEFANTYEQFYYPGFADEMKQKTFVGQLDRLNLVATKKHNSLYLIIDEYDNFTNNILNEKGEDVYHALTHASGFYRDIFKKFKVMFQRIFMTGVSPVTLDDLTSGFNIATNISWMPNVNALLGFDEKDVRTMLQYYKDAGLLSANIDIMISNMKPWYDNYCFSSRSLDKPRVFNSDMVLYYISSLLRSGHAPKVMIDSNTKTDYKKIWKLIEIDNITNQNKEIIPKIAVEGKLTTKLVDSFPALGLIDPANFISLLYYYGMLTIVGSDGLTVDLDIPNNNVRKQYYEYILNDFQRIKNTSLLSLTKLFRNMAVDGDFISVIKFIANAYKETSSVRSSIEEERSIQSFMAAYLGMCDYYFTTFETELAH